MFRCYLSDKFNSQRYKIYINVIIVSGVKVRIKKQYSNTLLTI